MPYSVCMAVGGPGTLESSRCLSSTTVLGLFRSRQQHPDGNVWMIAALFKGADNTKCSRGLQAELLHPTCTAGENCRGLTAMVVARLQQ